MLPCLCAFPLPDPPFPVCLGNPLVKGLLSPMPASSWLELEDWALFQCYPEEVTDCSDSPHILGELAFQVQLKTVAQKAL